jgi:hypothetical protein
MKRAGNNKLDERDLLPLNVLLNCRTVVEGKNVLTTGVMTRVEGELFEVELHEFEKFELGETVKLTIYSPAGIQTMPSVIFAKYEGAIALLQPAELHKKFKDRREHPRVDITGNAQIIHVLKETGHELELTEPVELTIHDISVSGIGFSGPGASHFGQNMKIKAQVQVGIGFSCELVIIRREPQEDGILWGAKMIVLEPEMLRPLRALILRQQVEKHAQMRREMSIKQSFNA